jgi:hypothetical protein
MQFHERKYEVYAILGSPRIKPWTRSTWNKIAAAIDPLVRVARGRPFVEAFQIEPRRKPGDMRPLRFGRVSWNERSFDKWVHARDGRLASGIAAHFRSCTLLKPSYAVSWREHCPPDLFFTLDREELEPFNREYGTPLKFGSVCILAVASDLGRPVQAQARRGAEAVALALDAVLRAHCVRPWGYRGLMAGWYTDAIDDLTGWSLLKFGPRHQQSPTLSMLKRRWRTF